MDPFLTEFYGTNLSEEEKEKVAQLQWIEKMAEEEGVDLNELSDEDIEYLLSEDEGEEYEEEGEEASEEEPEEESMEASELEAMNKVAEADYLGRVMAHANWQETQEILKQAASGKPEKKGKKAGPGWWARKHEGVKGFGGKMLGLPDEGKKATTSRGKYLMDKLKTPKARSVAKSVAGYGVPGAAAAGLGGGAAYLYTKGRKHGKKKEQRKAEKAKMSADEIVHYRALELLEEAGYNPEDVFEKTAQDEHYEEEPQYTQADVDRAALSYLEDLGVPVQWYE